MSHLEDATQTTGATRSGAAGGPAGATPRRVARDGREAVRLAVRAIYGEAAVDAAAIADGLAFAGRHAAVLALDGAGVARPRAPWVLHRVGEDDGPDGFEVEFAADDVQDAVDHVVVARAVAAGAGFPVACRIAPAAADRIALVRIPSSAPAIDASGPPESIADAVTAACDAVTARTGRAIRGRVRLADGTTGFLHERDGRHAIESTPAPAGPEPRGAGRSVVLGASPDGAHAERFLLDVATAIAGDAPLALRRGGGPRDVATLAIDDGKRASGDDGVDVLVLGHPAWLRRADVVSSAREGATVVVLSAPADPGKALAGLSATARAAIVDRRLSIAWSPVAGDDPDAVLGAVLRAGTPLHAFTGGDPTATSKSTGVLRGAASVAGPAALDTREEPARFDPDFAAPDARPAEPAAVEIDDDTAVAWRDRVRRFHAGSGAGADIAPGGSTWPAPPLRPAAVEALETHHGGPVFVLEGPDGLGGRSLRCWMRELLGARLTDFPVLSENLDLLSVAATRAVADGPSARPASAAFEDLAELTRRGLDVSEAGAEARDRELELLRQALPDGAMLVRGDAGAPFATYLAVLRADRGARREAFLTESRALAARLREILQSDDAHAPASAEAIRDAVGDMGDLFDAEALSDSLGERRGPTPLESARRVRIEDMLAILESEAERVVADGDVVVVHDGSLPPGADAEGVRQVEHPSALEAAAGLHDGIASRHVPWFRAIRGARLEVESAYDPALHDAVLARFDARGLSAEEAYVLPTVAVVIRPDRVRGAGLAALSDVLRSGRPIHVLIAADPLAADAASSFATHATGLGYVAAAHREAFVLESTLDRPRHLVGGLRRMVEVLRPAAAVVSVPSRDARTGDRRLAAALDGRATVCFRYDAAAGVTWADRFALDGNPQPERPWPRHDFPYTDDGGNTRTRSEALTFAHAVALEPGHRGRFLVVPREAWSDEQVEISEWLTLPDGERRRHAPFLWVVSDDGELARAVVTRDLGLETLDRMRAWRTLQELAGTDNEHARRAAEAARRDALAEAESVREALERRKDEEVEQARTTAAAEAMDRLVQSLMNLDALPSAVPGASIAPPPPAAPAEAEAAPEAEAVVEEPPAEDDEDFVDEAYIDSALCTSCQECININPKLYRYDGNKQAFIADVEAGTFEELVKGAEKCPARCIHPGAPRAGDATATDAMIARAAKFN